MENATLAQLVAARIVAKREEDSAAEHRKELDKQIAALMARADKPEGSVTEKLDDGLKVIATFTVNRKVDDVALKEAWPNLSETAQGAFRWKPEVSVSVYKTLAGADLLAASKFVTSTPGSTSIKVEVA